MGGRRERTSICPPLEIGTKNQNFIENLTSATQLGLIDLIIAMTVYFPVRHSHCTRSRFTVLVSYSGELADRHLSAEVGCETCEQIVLLLAFTAFKDVLGTRFGSLALKIVSLESEKIIIGYLESEKIGSPESEKSGPYRSIPGT